METDILGYNGNYTLTKSGDVFSYKYKKKRKLKPQKVSQSTKGYYQVRLFGDKGDFKGKLQYVHRLVYQTLIGDIPEGKEIDHIDGDTTNNSVENLQLLTPRENKVKGLDKNWRPYRKKFIKDYQKLGTYKKVAAKYGINHNIVFRVIKDVYHKKNFMTGKYETHRFNSEFSDYYTETNFKKVRGRDEKGRYE
jgi:hypothetical protein